ncbi:MAG: hypothetical protein RL341_562 [Pseudomonadota bacterium]|jgi:hypothetical protein
MNLNLTYRVCFLAALAIFVLAVAGCSKPPETLQDTYASVPDCLRDWAYPALCLPEPDKSPGAGKKSMHVLGPRYVADERAQLVRGSESASRRLATRKGGDQGRLLRAEKRN